MLLFGKWSFVEDRLLHERASVSAKGWVYVQSCLWSKCGRPKKKERERFSNLIIALSKNQSYLHKYPDNNNLEPGLFKYSTIDPIAGG